MSTKHTQSVRWHILKDADGRVHFSSDLGLKIVCNNIDEAHSAFETMVSNTMDVVDSLLKQRTSTIKFYLEF